MPTPLSIKIDGAYLDVVAANAKMKVQGAYVDAPGIKVKINGAYEALGTGVAPSNITPPGISGIPDVGETLTCTPGSWDGDPAPVITHQWFLFGDAITNADQLTYVVRPEDAGGALDVVEYATNAFGSDSAISEQVFINP